MSNNFNNNNSSNKYGLGASGFAIALTGTVFFCLATGTAIIGLTGYSAEAFRLSSFWTMGFGSLTWFAVFFSPKK
ncbi:MAG: hypothetical protein HY986_08375 [Candidatus Melainabacteria bacterium]|nr:hypothetical protein [Candidatus Melainabacteria bacterium]